MNAFSDPNPSAPQLLGPAPNDIVDGRAVTFEWDDIQGASGYRVQVAYDEDFTDLQLDADVGSATALTVYDALPVDGARLLWRVAAQFSGKNLFSDAQEIEVAVETVPVPTTEVEETPDTPQLDTSVPQLATPLDGELTDGMATTFEWEQADEAQGYYLQIAEDVGFSDIVLEAAIGDTNTLTIYDALPLDGPEMSWRVGALGDTDTRWSSSSTFSAVSNLAERVRQTARPASYPTLAREMKTEAVPLTSTVVPGQTGSMHLAFLWVALTTVAALVILLKILMT